MLNKQFWSRKHDISRNTKYRVYQSTVRSVLLYGAETWPLRKGDIEKLCAFENRCFRKILNIPPRQHITNDFIMKVFPNHVPLETHLRRRQLTWLGHVLRMPQARLPRKIFLTPYPNWKKRAGGQRQTWDNAVKTLLESTGVKKTYRRFWHEDWKAIVEDIAKDRCQWASLSHSAS
jgi:hypothetical protein